MSETTPSTGPSAAPRGLDLRALAVLGLLAAGVRWIAAARTAVLFDDGPIFLALAEALSRGDWTDVLLHPHHPLYPAATALVARVTGSTESAAVAVSIAGGTAAVWALFDFVARAFDRRSAWLAGAVLACHPFAVSFSADVQSDGLYLGLFLAAVALLWRGLESPSRPGWAAAAGVAAGLAYGVRPEGLGLLGVGVLVGLAVARREGWPRRRALGWSAALVGAGLLAAAPYPVALRAASGEWLVTQKKSVAEMAGLAGPESRPALDASPLAPPAALPRADDRTPARDARPGRWLAARAWDLYASSVSAFRFELLPLLAVGLVACRGRPGRRAWLAGILAASYGAVLVALVLTSGYVSRRHALPPLVPLFGWVGLGLASCADRLADGLAAFGLRRRPGTAPLLATLAIALVLLPQSVAPRRSDRMAERLAAEWLRERAEPGAPVAAGRPRVAYYAGRPYVPLPSGPEEGMLAYLRSRGARYVIVDEGKLDDHAGLRAARAGLERVHRSRAAGRAASVYRLPEPESAGAAPREPAGPGATGP